MHILIIPGLIPKLVKEGFSGKIICTPATKDLTEILLHDSAEIQTYETDSINRKREAKGHALYEPLYNSEDVTKCLSQFETIEYNTWFTVAQDVDVLYTSTGHIVGSAAVS